MKDRLKYYIKNTYGFRTEISQDKFYSLKRRKDAHLQVHVNGGIKTGYSISFQK